MTLARLPDWEKRLSDYLQQHQSHAHHYGRFDCMLFVAGAIKAVSGRDFARGHRRKYGSAIGAGRYLKSLGHDSAEQMLDGLMPAMPKSFARRGDIVLSGSIPGVCIGADALFAGDSGLVREPMSQCQKAWAVGLLNYE